MLQEHTGAENAHGRERGQETAYYDASTFRRQLGIDVRSAPAAPAASAWIAPQRRSLVVCPRGHHFYRTSAFVEAISLGLC